MGAGVSAALPENVTPDAAKAALPDEDPEKIAAVFGGASTLPKDEAVSKWEAAKSEGEGEGGGEEEDGGTDDDDDDCVEFVPRAVAPGKVVKRNSVVCSVVKVAEDYKPPVIPKSDAECAFLNAALRELVFLKELNDDEFTVFVMAMQKKDFEDKAELIKQGAEGDLFYIIESGKCEIFVEGVGKVMDIPTAEGRKFFGELALLYDAPRAATVVATGGAVSTWTLDRLTFKSILTTKALNDAGAPPT